MQDLINHESPVTLYLVVRAEDKDRMRPLLRLIDNQLVRFSAAGNHVERGRPQMPHEHRLLLMLDEFPSYGKLEVFQEALAYVAGYGIKAHLIMQDMYRLWAAYGKDESVTSNCHVRIAYAPNRVETAEWLSRMVGTSTVVKEDVTTSGKRFGAVLTQVSKTYHQIQRPLLNADEIMRLRSPVKAGNDLIVEPGDMLVFVSGHAPIFGTQSLYFLDPVFQSGRGCPCLLAIACTGARPSRSNAEHPPRRPLAGLFGRPDACLSLRRRLDCRKDGIPHQYDALRAGGHLARAATSGQTRARPNRQYLSAAHRGLHRGARQRLSVLWPLPRRA